MDAQKLKRKWLLFGGTGMAFTGLGLSVIGEGVILKVQDAVFWKWFGVGLIGLIFFNAGLGLFGRAVIIRKQIEDNQQNS